MPNIEVNHAVMDEPTMVMGFIAPELHDRLRRMAAEEGCSQSRLVSQFIKAALTTPTKRQRLRREPQ